MSRTAALEEHLAHVLREASTPMLPQPTGVEPRLEKLGGIRSVVFDVYGTLFISGSGDISLAENQERESLLLATLRHSPLKVRDTSRGYNERFLAIIGQMHEEARANGVEHPEVEIREVWERFLRAEVAAGRLEGNLDAPQLEELAVRYECRVNPIWPMPWLEETLRELHECAKMLGIVSNAQFFTPLLFPAFLHLRPPQLGFGSEYMLWSYAQGVAKPSTEMYRELAARLADGSRIEPHEVLYVGNDMRNDIWPAQEVGFRTALFAGDGRSLRLREDDARCTGVTPDLVLTELRQLIEVL